MVKSLKVGRREDPKEDARIVAAVREAVGPSIKLRADANRKWDLEQAISFGEAAAHLSLEVCLHFSSRHWIILPSVCSCSPKGLSV